MNSPVVLQIDTLSKQYGDITAVDRVSFTVASGQIVGLLGPNGAGKSTTINMILGILEPTSGSIRIFDLPMPAARREISRHTNFSAVYAHVPPNLTVRQNLRVFGLLYGVPHLGQRIEELLQEFDLVSFADSRAGLLSSGEMSRLHMAKATMNRPRLLLLDEPTASLDPSVALYMRDRIRTYVAETSAAVLWTSHNMREIEAVCDQVLFLSHGHILLSGNPRTLPGEYGKSDLEELFITVAREPLSLRED